jgi:hypothetical protein
MVIPAIGQVIQNKEHKSVHDFQSGGALNINSFRGSVRLSSWDQKQVEVIAHISAPTGVSEDYARRAVEATRIEIKGDARALTIEASYKDVPYGDGKDDMSRTLPAVRFEVRAPRNISLNIKADISNVELTGFDGKIALNTDRTDIDGTDLSGDLRVHMDRGDATLAMIKGRLDVQIERGDVTLDAVEILEDSRIETGRGSIEVKLAQGQGLSLRGHVASLDNLRSELPVQLSTLRGNRIEGTLNGGGPELFFKTDRGKIHLKH